MIDNKIYVIKSSGERQLFNPDKIKITALRAGASEELANKVVDYVVSKIHDGIKTREVLNLISQFLDKEQPAISARYALRDALFRMGPAGFEFEKYIAALFAAYSYKTKLPPLLQGACIMHEIDVVAEKDKRKIMIEVKLRRSLDIFITIKDVMSSWARFLDLVDGAAIGKCEHLDEAWLVTNSKISQDGLQFGHCKNMVLLSWNHPKERPLPAWIDDVGLYPVTILKSVDESILHKFGEAKIMLLRDLVDLPKEELFSRIKLPQDKILSLIKEAEVILKK